MKEIYWDTTREMMLLEDLEKHTVNRFDELPQSFFINIDAKIKFKYPEQHAELVQLIGRVGCEYGRVYQFCACNFSTKDGQPDIDDDGNFIFEKVSCPVRLTCKRTTCRINAESLLSKREIEVIKYFTLGKSEEEIADCLFISKSTVHNHINNIYHKLQLTGAANPDRLLVAYAIKNKIAQHL